MTDENGALPGEEMSPSGTPDVPRNLDGTPATTGHLDKTPAAPRNLAEALAALAADPPESRLSPLSVIAAAQREQRTRRGRTRNWVLGSAAAAMAAVVLATATSGGRTSDGSAAALPAPTGYSAEAPGRDDAGAVPLADAASTAAGESTRQAAAAPMESAPAPAPMASSTAPSYPPDLAAIDGGSANYGTDTAGDIPTAGTNGTAELQACQVVSKLLSADRVPEYDATPAAGRVSVVLTSTGIGCPQEANLSAERSSTQMFSVSAQDEALAYLADSDGAIAVSVGVVSLREAALWTTASDAADPSTDSPATVESGSVAGPMILTQGPGVVLRVLPDGSVLELRIEGQVAEKDAVIVQDWLIGLANRAVAGLGG